MMEGKGHVTKRQETCSRLGSASTGHMTEDKLLGLPEPSSPGLGNERMG